MYIIILSGLVLLTFIVNQTNKKHNINNALIEDILNYYTYNHEFYEDCIMLYVVLDYCNIYDLNADDTISSLPYDFINTNLETE